jgi:hypothetical protein
MLLVGCKKETTYTLKWNTEGIQQIKTDVIILEYSKDNEIVNNNSITGIKYGGSYSYTAHGKAEKCKLQLTWSYLGNSTDRWIGKVYYLDKGEHTDIIVDDNTLVGKTEP